jgi:hypothetical protein
MLALTPTQVASSLGTRPYDLRHAAVSLWLNAGVPVTEVAKRAGHSVDVLLRVYAKCIDGQQDHINGKINDALERITLVHHGPGLPPGPSACGTPPFPSRPRRLLIRWAEEAVKVERP